MPNAWGMLVPLEEVNVVENTRPLVGKVIFRLRHSPILGAFRSSKWRALGMKVGATFLPRMIDCAWPHQVRIGDGCSIETGVAFKFDGPWMEGPRIRIGDRCFIGRNCEFNIKCGIDIADDSLIASGCRFVDHDHGIDLGSLMRLQPGPVSAISVGRDVWIGANAVILKGVNIGSGAIIGAGAVVTKSVPAKEIWAGVPARKIGLRGKTTHP